MSKSFFVALTLGLIFTLLLPFKHHSSFTGENPGNAEEFNNLIISEDLITSANSSSTLKNFLFGSILQTTSTNEIYMGGVLGFHKVELKDQTDQQRFESFIMNDLYPGWRENMPGCSMVMMKGDRGNRVGKYISVLTFKNMKWYEYYCSEGNIDEQIQSNPDLEPLQETWSRFLEFTGGTPDYLVYKVIGRDQYETMPAIELMGIHDIEIKPGMGGKLESFMIQRWNGQVAIPGMWGIVLKGVSEDNDGDYIWISAFDPGDMRDAYFPEAGQGSDAWAQAILPIQKLFDEVYAYMEIIPGTEGYYTDYMAVR